MAKFTVFFKDKPIHSSIHESGVVHIGRDETNDVSVDSLAIAPAHAAVILRDTGSVIKQLNADFPLIVNGEQQRECNLQHGDTITIGKHRIVYSDSETVVAPFPARSASKPGNKVLDAEILAQDHPVEANFQVMGGKHIGRLVPLKKTMTRLGRDGSGIVIVTKRKEGYFVSMLEPNESIKLNNSPLADNTILLKNGDTLLIDSVPMQFYMG